MSFPAGTKFVQSQNNLYECIVEYKPCKRTIAIQRDMGYNICEYIPIEIPFYQIFYLRAMKVGPFYYSLCSDVETDPLVNYPNKLCGSLESISSLDDFIYPIHYPHVAPTNMNICQKTPSGFYHSFEDIVNIFLDQFWSAKNMFFMNNNFTVNDFTAKYPYYMQNNYLQNNYGAYDRSGYILKKELSSPIQIHTGIRIPIRNLFK